MSTALVESIVEKGVNFSYKIPAPFYVPPLIDWVQIVCLFGVLRCINSVSVIKWQQFTNLCFLDYF